MMDFDIQILFIIFYNFIFIQLIRPKMNIIPDVQLFGSNLEGNEDGPIGK